MKKQILINGDALEEIQKIKGDFIGIELDEEYFNIAKEIL